MAEIDNIIEIQITKQVTVPTTASFNIPMFLAAHTAFIEKYRIYTDIDALSEDFPSGNVYTWGLKVFGQSVRPPSVVIGRRSVNVVAATVGAVTVGNVYSITVNGTNYPYTAVGGDDAADVSAGLKIQYELAPKAGVTFVDNLNGTFTINASVGFSFKASTGITLTNTTNETLVQAYQGVKDAYNDWYAVTSESHSKADIEALAEVVQADHKIYIAATDDTDVPTSATTDVGSELQAAGYTRTALVYHTLADTQYPEAAWIGSQLPQTVGSNDWCFKQAAGVTADNLTDTQRSYLRGKNVNMFTRVSGINIFQDGDMIDGRPITEQIIVDWTHARMQEAIYFRLINTLKVPFTRSGFSIIENEMRTVLQQGVANGAYSSFTVTAPDPLLISQADRANGIAGDFKFTAVLAGSIRKVTIKGTLTI